MKKITLLLLSMVCITFVPAQTNLLTNPSFETWTSGVPDGWTLGNSAYATSTENTSIFTDGAKSLKVTPVSSNGGTYSISQIIPITPGATYTLSMSYYIEAGDGTDARIWSDWCNVVQGQTTTYATLSHADSVLLMGPGGGSAYFPDERSTWKTYSVEVTAPTSGYNSFSFQFRTYKTPAIVYWDNMSFAQKPTGLSKTTINNLKVRIVGTNLVLDNATTGSVEIYSVLGSRVKSATLSNGKIDISDLAKGSYIVRCGNDTQKVLY